MSQMNGSTLTESQDAQELKKEALIDSREFKKELMEFIDTITILPRVLVQMVTDYWSPTKTEGKFHKKWSVPHVSPHAFPLGVAHDGHRIFVSDTNESCLYVYSLEGKHIDTWTSPPKLLSIFLKKNNLSFKDPKGIDFDGDYLYIIDVKYIRQIDKITKKVKGKWTLPKGTIEFCGRGGCGLKVNDGKIYFTLWDSHQIYSYHPESGKLKIFGKSFSTWRGGSGVSEFDHPRGLTVAGRNLYICDLNNHRIQVLDKGNGDFVRQWGQEGTKEGQLYFPESIFFHDELLYVGDSDRVQVFGKEGGFVQRIGGTKNKRWCGERDGEFKNAIGVCIVKNKLYVIDNGNQRIQVFT